MAHRRTRRSRRNPWASAKPASWGSMTRAERKAWNRANWQKTSGGAPAPKKTRLLNIGIKPGVYDERDVMTLPKNTLLIKGPGAIFASMDVALMVTDITVADLQRADELVLKRAKKRDACRFLEEITIKSKGGLGGEVHMGYGS